MESINASIPPEGGEVGFSYEFTASCKNKIIDFDKTGDIDNFKVVYLDEHGNVVTENYPEKGMIQVTAEALESGEKNLTITPLVNNKSCDAIRISQTANITCVCDNITSLAALQTIPTEGLANNSEICSYTLDNECDLSLFRVKIYDEDGNETNIKVNIVPNDSKSGTFVLPNGFPSTTSVRQLLFTVKVLYWDGSSENFCNGKDVTLVQEGTSEKCDCKTHLNYMISTFVRTFKDEGTTEDVMIASAHTFCGTIEAGTLGCAMLNEGYPKTVKNLREGNFYFYVSVNERTDTTIPRNCTINFHFWKQGETYEQRTQCSKYMVITQNGQYCRCSNITKIDDSKVKSELNWAYLHNFSVVRPSRRHVDSTRTGCYAQDGGTIEITVPNESKNCMGIVLLSSNSDDIRLEGSDTSKRQYINVYNNESFETRTLNFTIGYYSDYEKITVQGETWEVGELCESREYTIIQYGLPNCNCNNLGIRLWDYISSWEEYEEVSEFSIDGNWHIYDKFYFTSDCYELYHSNPIFTCDECARFSLDTTNTSSWLTFTASPNQITQCESEGDKVGEIPYKAEQNPSDTEERSTSFDIVYNDGKGVICRKTCTVTQAAYSGGGGHTCGCDDASASNYTVSAIGSDNNYTIASLWINYATCSFEGEPTYNIDWKGMGEWITQITLGQISTGYAIYGKVLENNTTSKRDITITFNYTINGQSCSKSATLTQEKYLDCGEEGCGSFYTGYVWGFQEGETKFTKYGKNEAIIGTLYCRNGTSYRSLDCFEITVKPQEGDWGIYVDKIETTIVNKSYKEIKVKVLPNGTGDLETCAITLQVSLNGEQCLYERIILLISGNENLPS